MELQHSQNDQLVKVFNQLNSHNLDLVIAFLDPESIIAVAQTGKISKGGPRRLFLKARIHAFLLQYINKTDRSIYMPFYSQSPFLSIERDQLAYLTIHHQQGLSLLASSWEKVMRSLKKQLGDFQQGQQILDSLVQSLTDPELPFPKLRKQNIGMHCNSAFQFYLIYKLFPNGQEEEVEETFQELGKYLSEKWSLTPQNQKMELDIIEEVFSSWFKITYQNFSQYLLPGNGHHNVVVLILALLDLFVDSFCFYLQAIKDPLYSFVEFNLRFCIFRNVLLSLEQKLSPIFKSYSIFCKEIMEKKRQLEMQIEGVQNEEVREMTIWHCGLSKWYIYMQHLHPNHFKTYFYILKKTNLQYIKDNNQDHLKDHQTYIELHNRLQLSEVSLLEHQKTFEVHSPLEDILNEDPTIYSQLLKEYIEYIVDISINEYSVHWCGHSDHIMHIPYQEFDKMVVENYQTYIDRIQQIALSVADPITAIDSMLSSMIEQLDKQFLKPVTLKKILKLSKESTVNVCGQNRYEESELAKNSIEIYQEIQNRDKVMNHFNENAGISNEISYKYSIVLENEDFAKLLKTSASTNASYLSQGHMNMHSLRSNDSLIEEDFV